MRISANNYINSDDAGYVIDAYKAEEWADELDALLAQPPAKREKVHETIGYETDYMRGRREMREEIADGSAPTDTPPEKMMTFEEWKSLSAESRHNIHMSFADAVAAERDRCESEMVDRCIEVIRGEVPVDAFTAADRRVFQALEAIRATPASEPPRTRKCGCGVEIPRDNSMCDSCYAAFNDESGVLPIQVRLPSTGSTTLNAPASKPTGTMNCPRCGKNTPHNHDHECCWEGKGHRDCSGVKCCVCGKTAPVMYQLRLPLG